MLAVDYLFAALIYTMLGRFVLGLFVPPEWDNYIWRFFRRVTDPVLAVTERLTPGFMVELSCRWWRSGGCSWRASCSTSRRTRSIGPTF